MLRESYWNGNGKYQSVYDKLWNDLVPGAGEAETTEGELIRAVGRLSYEWYNNGNCNALYEECVIDSMYQEFLDLIEMHVPDTRELIVRMSDIIKYENYSRSQYTEDNELVYVELTDRVVEYVAGRLNIALPAEVV